MPGTTNRQLAVASIAATKGVPVPVTTGAVEQYFGCDVFGLAEMKARLPKHIFRSVKKTIEEGAKLDSSVADVVAAAMKEWAQAKGVTHYAHVFYPLTGFTAEKHDAWIDPTGDGKAISEFTGKALIQGEPDASSFPSGGIRATAEARGYTAWDVTSYAYVMDGSTLCIPAAFVSWTGEALDKKTPLLRSNQALDKQVQRVLRLFGHTNIAKVVANAGPEQEYFLIDKKLAFERPDLITAGRTLFGAPPPKGQEFEDQYFGAIPARVLAYMRDVETQLYRLGVPVKTRHNEVAPGQYEIAPIFESANMATDHQHLIMLVLKRVADQHGFVAALHEKPFAGINGSGKHVNYSFGNATQGNLLDPGETPHDNAQFLVFCGAILQAVSTRASLLRASIASAANDHRLGANEAPPAIISIFLGEQLADVFEQIKAGGAKTSKSKGTLKIGADVLPELPRDSGDRNRTSPFAFCGNRFEFRAVGGHQSIAGPLIAVNLAVTEAVDDIATKLEKAIASGMDLNTAVQSVLQKLITEHEKIVFNGNGYSKEWHEEAARRGLPNLRTTIDALPVLAQHSTSELFEKYDVLTEREVHSRYEVYLEQYAKSVAVEAKLVLRMGRTMILPAALRYQKELVDGLVAAKSAGLAADDSLAKAVNGQIVLLEKALGKLAGLLGGDVPADALDAAKFWCNDVLPTMLEVRAPADVLEGLVADDLWPLPTYQELCFVR